MKKTQFGFIAIPFILAAIVMIGGGYYFIDQYSKPNTKNKTREIILENNNNKDEIEDKVVKNNDIATSTRTTTSDLTPATTTVVEKEEKKLDVKVQVAPVVVKKPFITISKKDLFERDIAKFSHLDWTYSFDDKLAFMGKSGFHEVNTPSHSVGYTFTGDDIVNYYARMTQFESHEDAKKLLNKVKNDNNNFVYNKSFPLVYDIRDLNSRSLMWVHNNILIMIHTNIESPKGDQYLNTAFNTYIDIYPSN